MTDSVQHDDDGLAAPGAAVSACAHNVADAGNTDQADATGWDERNGPPIHDPGCACGACPEGSW